MLAAVVRQLCPRYLDFKLGKHKTVVWPKPKSTLYVRSRSYFTMVMILAGVYLFYLNLDFQPAVEIFHFI